MTYKVIKAYKKYGFNKGDIVGLKPNDAKELVADGVLVLLNEQERDVAFEKIKEANK